MQCLEARLDVDPSGEIMVLDRFCPVSILPALSVIEFFVHNLPQRIQLLLFFEMCTYILIHSNS